MSSPKTKRKHKGSSKARRARRRIRKMQTASYSVIGVGDLVHRGKGKRRVEGKIVGWSFDGKRRLTWIIGPRDA